MPTINPRILSFIQLIFRKPYHSVNVFACPVKCFICLKQGGRLVAFITTSMPLLMHKQAPMKYEVLHSSNKLRLIKYRPFTEPVMPSDGSIPLYMPAPTQSVDSYPFSPQSHLVQTFYPPTHIPHISHFIYPLETAWQSCGHDRMG